MPLVRYEIRSEYELANRELYRSAPKNDPEAILEGVAMVSLVGIVRQLGDLAEFAADIFHDLHEAVMATASRSHDLSARVAQLEAELPALEKMVFSKKANPLQYAYSPGVDWHASIRSDQNHCTQGDLPRFIRSSYEECRGPPRLFLLDKFDIGGVGACLKRYTDPSFFKMEWASSELMKAEKAQQDKKARKGKKTRRRKDGEVKESRPAMQIQPRMRYSSISMSSLDGLSESTTPLTAMAVDNELSNKSFPFVTFLGGSQHSSSKESAPNKLDLPKVVKPVRTSFKGTDENVQPEETKESIVGGKESVARDDAEDAASEPENYMDAMTTMESETDSEPRDRRRLSNFKMSVVQPELETDSKTNDNDAYFEDARNSTMDSETEVDSKYSLDLTPMPVDPLSAQELTTSTPREVHGEDMLILAKETWVEEAVGSREHESEGSEELEPSLEPLLEPAHENAMDEAVSEDERQDDQVLSEKEDVQEGARESQSISEGDDDEDEEGLIPESIASSEAKDHVQELSGARTGSDDEPFDVEVIQVIGDDRNQKVDLEPLSVSDDDSAAQAGVHHPMERKIVEDSLLKSEESTAREIVEVGKVADEPSAGFSHADMPSEQEEVHEKNVDSLALETVTQSPVHENEYTLIEEVRDSDAGGGYPETKMPGDVDHLEMKAEDADHLERKVAENGDYLEMVGERLEMKVEEDNDHPQVQVAEHNDHLDHLETKVAEDNGHQVAEDNDHLEMKVPEATDHLEMKVAEELVHSPPVKTIHIDEVEEESVPPMVIATDQEGNENVTEEPDDATSSTPVALAKESHESDRSIPSSTLVDAPEEMTNTPFVSPLNAQPASPADDYESASSHEDFFMAQDHDRSSSRFSDFSDDLSWHNEGLEVDEHKDASDGYSGYEDSTGNERSVNEVRIDEFSGYEDSTGNERSVNEVRMDETVAVLNKETSEVFSQPDRDLGELDQQPASFAHVEDDIRLRNRSCEEDQLEPEFTDRVEDGHTSEQSPRSQLLAYEVDAETDKQQLSFEKQVDVEDFALPETVPKSDQRQLVDVEDSTLPESVPKSDQRELVDFEEEMSPKSDQLRLVDLDSNVPEMVPQSDRPQQLVDFEDSTVPEMVLQSVQRQLVDFEDSTVPKMVPESDQPQQLVDFEDSTVPEMVLQSDQRQLVDFEDSTLPGMVTKSDQRQHEDSALLSVLSVVVPETRDNEALPGSADELLDKSPVSGMETSPEVSVGSSPRSPIFSALHAPMSPARSFESLSSGLARFTSLPAPSSPTSSSTLMEEMPPLPEPSSPTSSSTLMEEMPPLPPLPPLRWRTVWSPRLPQETLPRLETLQQEPTEVPRKQDAVEQPPEASKPSESSQAMVEDQPNVPSVAEAPAQRSQMLEREVDLLDVSGSHTQEVPNHEPELMRTEAPELVDSRLEVPECHPEHAELRSEVLEPVPPEVHRTEALEHQPEAVEPLQVMEDHLRPDLLEQPAQPRPEQPEVKEPSSEAHAGELEDEKPKLEPKTEPVLEQSPGVKADDSQRSEPPPRVPSPRLEDDSRVLPVSTMPSSRKHPADEALVQAISGHDRSKLRRVPSDPRSKAPGEREFLLEQIRSQSFNLRHTVVEKKESKEEAPPRLVTNINVAAILEKANAIRQAFAGSDDDDEEDDWSE